MESFYFDVMDTLDEMRCVLWMLDENVVGGVSWMPDELGVVQGTCGGCRERYTIFVMRGFSP